MRLLCGHESFSRQFAGDVFVEDFLDGQGHDNGVVLGEEAVNLMQGVLGVAECNEEAFLGLRSPHGHLYFYL